MNASDFVRRRPTRAVMVGHVGVGGENPIRVQSMITCDTMDTEASIAQTIELADVGCEIVRITAPTVKDAANLQHIVRGLRERGCDVPIVADIHFKPDAAMEAAKWVDKVRINPGNYADSKKFKIIEYSDAQYAAELARIRERFTPLVRLSKERGIAMRIGTNHGSLSDRIMNRYGDTPLGMVESALEFARIARALDYHALIFSMKSSNPKVMIAAYRLLVARLDAEGADWNYPIHLGVTEAGEGEDARIKSAIGIGSLLNDGIGDTIRVSLTEDSVHEIPVARALARLFGLGENSGNKPAISLRRSTAEGSGRTAKPGGRTAEGRGQAAKPGGRMAEASGWTAKPSDPISKPGDSISSSSGPTTGPRDRVPEAGDRTAQVGRESPQARDLRQEESGSAGVVWSFDPFSYSRRTSAKIERDGCRLGGEELVRVAIRAANFAKIAHKIDRMGDYKPEFVYEESGVAEVDPRDEAAIAELNRLTSPRLVTVRDGLDLPVIAAFRLLAARLEPRHPILLKDTLRHSERSGAERHAVEESRGETSRSPSEPSGEGFPATPRDPSTAPPASLGMTDASDFLTTLLVAATNIGALLCDGIGDAILVQGEHAPGQAMRLSYNILQAARSRVFKTDYVACPSCGRTLFNLQTTTARIKEATSHLKGVTIAVMGCIVNGPGEMADADFGYVGGAPGKINLYVGKTAVKFNIPEAEAVSRLQDLIREHGKWVEPPPRVAGEVAVADAAVG